MINLARENALPSVLPATFYNCCSEATTFDEIFQGIRRQDNTIAILSTEDQQICIKGWRRLIEMQAGSLYRWLDAERNHALFDNACASPTRCAAPDPLFAPGSFRLSPSAGSWILGTMIGSRTCVFCAFRWRSCTTWPYGERCGTSYHPSSACRHGVTP